MYTNTERFLRALRYRLKQKLPELRSSEIAETLAFSLGLNSAISLANWAKQKDRKLLCFSSERFDYYFKIKGWEYLLKEYSYQFFLRTVWEAFYSCNCWQEFGEHELTSILCLGLDIPEPEIWLNKAHNLVGAVLEILCEQREHLAQPLTTALVTNCFHMEWLHLIVTGQTNSSVAQQQKVKDYLGGLTGYKMAEPPKQWPTTAKDEHGYLKMFIDIIFGFNIFPAINGEDFRPREDNALSRTQYVFS